MLRSKKWLLAFGVLMVLGLVLSACGTPEPQVVTQIVTGEPGETIIQEVTVAPDEPMDAGPIAADGMVECQPLPDVPEPTAGNAVAAAPAGPSAPTVASAPRVAPASSSLQAGQIYRVGVFEDVTTLNYFAANGPDNTVYNSYMLPERLALYGLSMKFFDFVPNVAADLPAPLAEDADGNWTVDIPIRDDIVWSDGEQFTAEDVAWTANAVLDLGLISGNWSSWYDSNFVAGMEAVDDYTVRIIYHTKPGLSRHEWGTLQAPILAEHYWAPIVSEALAPVEALGDSPADEDLLAAQQEAQDVLFSHVPDGEPTAGAFAMGSREAGAFLEGVAYDAYYQTGVTVTQYANGAYEEVPGTVYYGEAGGDVDMTYEIGPLVGQVVYSVYGTQDAALLALRNGEVDFMLNSLGLQRGLADSVRGDANLTVIENQTNGFRYLSFNNRRRPMNDCAFRQAVAVLIDKEFVTGTILQGVAFPLYSFVPVGNEAWYFDDAPKLGQGLTREQRTEFAKAILTQAGFSWEGGVEPVWDGDNRMVTPAGHLIMPDGVPVPDLNVVAPSAGYDPLRSTFAIWIESWLNEFGIPTTAQLAGFNVIVPIIFTEQNFDMYILGWSLGLFPDYLRDFFAEEQAVEDGNNAGGYISPQFEELASGMLTCESNEECKAIADEVQLLLSTEVPYVLLFDTGIIEAFRSASVEYPYTDGLSGLQYFHQGGAALQSTVNVK